MDAIITLENVRFTYRGVAQPVFYDLDLSIPDGAFAVLLGPNGTGKTTLLHLILGYRRPQHGKIYLAGQLQEHYTRREMSRLVGLVPQDEVVTFDFSVLDYTLLGRAPYIGPLDMPKDNDIRIAMEALEIAGVASLGMRSIISLSGGERQLVIIARALAQQPRILLLDEPTAHLDLSNRNRILRVLRALNQQGTTVVMTTHDPVAAAAVADFVVLMREGKVVEAGYPEDVFTAEKLSATYGVPVQVLRLDEQLIAFNPLR
ncbi:MAG: ABC transporter ATP-binding protein [Anaerolineae bacterium]